MNRLKFWLKAALFVVPLAYLANFWYAVESNQTGGTFGDTFGAANALFSGAALMMLVYAVILQREELSIVKSERNDTRKILESQEDLNKLQKSALDRQIFEQGFYSLLEVTTNERNRLNQRIVPHDAKSLLQQARIAATSILEFFLRDETIKQHLDVQVNEVFYYSSLLCRLSDSIDSSPLMDDEKVEFGQLLTALLEPNIAIVMLTYAIKFRQNEEALRQLFRFCVKHKLHSYAAAIGNAAELIRKSEEKFQN